VAFHQGGLGNIFADITYIPVDKWFVYLVAVMDWFSRRFLSWRSSIGMESDFCVEPLKEAIERHGPPEIFNTDQGVQFTSAEFIDTREARGVRVSMDGKGRFLDNRRRQIVPPARFLILLHHRASLAKPEV
jgi:putative transposase